MRVLSAAARKALSEQKDVSTRRTQKRLEQALQRLSRGTPETVIIGSRLTVSNVAKEAGVDRATLYRFHQPVLDAIRKAAGDSKPSAKKTRRNLTESEAKLKEYRALVEDAQSEVAALARINYRLDARIRELEELIRIRDRVITDLQLQLNQRPDSRQPTPLKRPRA